MKIEKPLELNFGEVDFSVPSASYKLKVCDEEQALLLENVKLKNKVYELEAEIKQMNRHRLDSGAFDDNALREDVFQKMEALCRSAEGRAEEKLRDVSEAICAHVDRRLVSSARDTEASISVQQYFLTGQLSLSYHGWTISADLGLLLAEMLEARRYDLVVEFGSGASTALFAKAFKNQENRASHYSLFNGVLDSESGMLSGEGVPGEPIKSTSVKVLSFEHCEHFYKETMRVLTSRSLEKAVKLVHAPLVEQVCGSEHYLYYDCDAWLEEAAEFLKSKKANILVLVDGPPGGTCHHARFPALIKMFDYLGSHRLDVVLDDYNRDEEKKIAEAWEDFLKCKGVEYSSASVGLKKGAFMLTINGSE